MIRLHRRSSERDAPVSGEKEKANDGRQGKVALTFALYQGDQLVRRETVTQDIVKVGKDPKSHLRVDDELASRMHAVIEVAWPEDITLIDLGNEPGTMVNGARVNKCKIHAGDQIQIGGTHDPARARGRRVGGCRRMPRAAVRRAARRHIRSARRRRTRSRPPAAAAAPAFARRNPFAAAASVRCAAASPFAHAEPVRAGRATHVCRTTRPPGTYTYTLVKSGPDVNPDEVEIAHVTAVEVMVLWDTNVLHVAHLTPPRSFYVGEEQGKNFACDYFIPSEKLGTTRAPVVLADRGVGRARHPARARRARSRSPASRR